MDTALLRGVDEDQVRATTCTTWHSLFSSRGARASRGLDPQTWQEPVLRSCAVRTGPAGPRGVRVSGGDRLGASHGRAVTPGQARTPHRRILPWRPSLRLANGPGCAGAHGTPSSGALRARHPKGRTTARAGGEKEGLALMPDLR
jgi:hypothetical protein